ncbi:MAG: DUF502 domain-containing protein [bacterium]|nr:DUF502 domain-containing protein [bacterium]
MSVVNKVTASIKRYFVSGVLVVIPLILTYIVLKFLFESLDGILQPLIFQVLGYYIPGLGIFTTLLIILLAGVLTRNFLGAKLHGLGESVLQKLPIIRPIYSASKQLLEALTHPSMTSFREVALIEYPRKGIYALCFVSHRIKIDSGQKTGEYTTCFIPSTPTPVSGMVVMVPHEEVFAVNMTVEEGIKFLVSGGVASPNLIETTKTYSNSQSDEVPGESG